MSKRTVPALITTKLDGVFFGYVNEDDITESKDTVIAEKIRMCIYWSDAMKGVLGLGAMGPDKDCRISKGLELGRIEQVTFIGQCSPDAAARWESEPWG